MFTITKDRLKESIKIMKGDVCAYGQKEINNKCDCKYRSNEKEHRPFSESFSGCCELSNVYLLLNNMTDVEYEEILKRKNDGKILKVKLLELNTLNINNRIYKTSEVIKHNGAIVPLFHRNTDAELAGIPSDDVIGECQLKVKDDILFGTIMATGKELIFIKDKLNKGYEIRPFGFGNITSEGEVFNYKIGGVTLALPPT